jgi:hypothetical protein
MPESEVNVKRRWILASALLVLTAVAVWQNWRAALVPRTAVDWAGVPRRDLVTAALYLDVQQGGPGLALRHLTELAKRDTALKALGHVYAHQVGRYALRWHDWDPGVYAECTPQFESGCYHGLIEAYLNHAPMLDQAELGRLCDRIVGSATPEVARRECAHGLGHGLWFHLHGAYREALSHCDQLASQTAQDECRDGVFMQRAGSGAMHLHHGSGTATPVRLGCAEEPARYRHACWHYQGRLFAAAEGYRKAFADCEAAADYASVCYWGLGKWIADKVRSAEGSDEQIISLCGQGRPAALGACLAGAAENLVDENWTTERAERLCRTSPDNGKAACYAKLAERRAILESHP